MKYRLFPCASFLSGVVICLIFLLLLLFRPYPEIFFGDPGFGWHLRMGQLLLESSGLMLYEPFLVGQQQVTWVYGQRLADLFFALLVFDDSFYLLYVIGAVLCLLPYMLVLLRVPCSVLAVIVLLPISLLAGSIQWLARPVLFSFLFFSILLLTLRCSDGHTKKRYYLFLLVFFALWSNLHPAFFIGFAALLVYAIAAASRGDFGQAKGLIVGLGFAVLGSVMNPHGFALHRASISLATSPYFQSLHREWLPPEFSEAAFYPFFLLAAIFLLFVMLSPRRLQRGDVLLSLLLVVLSCNARRYIPFFCLSSTAFCLEIASQSLGWTKRFDFLVATTQCGIKRALLTIGLATLLCSAASVSQQTLLARQENANSFSSEKVFALYPVALFRVFAEARKNSQDASLFHAANLGGSISYFLWPPRTAYIDDRNELFAEEAYRENEQILHAVGDWQRRFERLGADYVLLRKEMPLTKELASRGWREVGEQTTALSTYLLMQDPSAVD